MLSWRCAPSCAAPTIGLRWLTGARIARRGCESGSVGRWNTARHRTTRLALFRVLDASVFEARFRDWINELAGLIEVVVALDGKTLRGSGKKGSNELLHIVTAHT